MKFANNGSLKYIILSVIAVVLIAAILLGSLIADRVSKSNYDESVVLEYSGKEYVLKGGVETFLIIGVDKTDESLSADSYNNNQQADFLMLVVFDHVKQTYSTVHINRDTIAEVGLLSVKGVEYKTEKMQIALSHTQGDGDEMSNYNTGKSVSRLLHGVRVNHNISFTLDSVAEMNDIVGGVTVEVLDDFTHIDGGARLKKGETVKLTASEALLYVQHRRELGDNTNSARMARQKQYIEALRIELEKRLASDVDNKFLKDVSTKMSEHTKTDIEGLLEVSSNMQNYKFVEIDGIEGKSVLNEETQRMEFYPDDDSLKKLVVNLFYIPKN